MTVVTQGVRLNRPVEQQPTIATEQWALLKAALDGLQHATLICQPSADVVVGNDAAYDMLDKEDGIFMRTGRLVVQDQLTQHKLRTGLADELNVGAEGHRVGLLVPRPSGEAPYQLIARRLPLTTTRAPHQPGPLWAVSISDPGAALVPGVAAIAKLYGFTPAETRLAARLAGGEELQQIAQRLGVKITTIRSQLASLFAKTGTERQAQLVRLLTAHGLR